MVLSPCEASKQRRYRRKKTRVPRTDANLLEMILDIRKRRPFYGTRRVAAGLARRLGRPVNRKRVRRACRLAGWIKPAQFKADTKARWKPIEVARPNRVWQTDITCVWCYQADGWRRRFNTLAIADVAIESLVEAVAAAKPGCPGLAIRCDNGSQYMGKKFRLPASPNPPSRLPARAACARGAVRAARGISRMGDENPRGLACLVLESAPSS